MSYPEESHHWKGRGMDSSQSEPVVSSNGHGEAAATDLVNTAEPALSIAEAERNYVAAQKVERELKSRVEAEQRAAAAAVANRYAERTSSAMRVRHQAFVALLAAKDATPVHPWTGKRVFRIEETRKYHFQPSRPVRYEGVVETRRSSTEFPGNTSNYSMPQIGDGFVRLLKKDGKPGLKFEKLEGFHRSAGWSLLDEPPP